MTIETEIQIEEALIFMGIEVHPDECDICEDGSVYYGLTQILGKGSVCKHESGYIEDEVSDGDFTITPTGPLGGKSGLGRVNGNFVGEFGSDEDAYNAARAIMEEESFWPNVWIVSDHGNWSAYSE